MLLSYAQSAGAHGHGMDELSLVHLGHRPITYDEVTVRGGSAFRLLTSLLIKATSYAAEDADVTFRLWLKLKAMLVQNGAVRIYETMERPLIPVLQKMEWAGIKIDVAELQRLSNDFAARMKVMEAEIHQLVGRDFNIGSPKQLGEILFDEMSLSGGKRTKAGAWGTDSSVLQELADQGSCASATYPRLAATRETEIDLHRRAFRAAGTLKRRACTHPTIWLAPRRVASPQMIRTCKISRSAPRRGRASATLSSRRRGISLSRRIIPRLNSASSLPWPTSRPFRKLSRWGQDIHARTASEVFNVPLEGMDPLTRRRAKAINFGIIYGISAFGLARQLGIPQNEARHYIATYFERYPALKPIWIGQKRKRGRKAMSRRHLVAVVTSPALLRRMARDAPMRNVRPSMRPLQGGAADIIKMAMISVDRQLRDNDFNAQLLLQVHDELVFEVAAEKANMLDVSFVRR